MSTAPPSRAVTAAWTAVGVVTSVYYFSWLLQPVHAGASLLFGLLIVADLFNGFHAFSFWLTCLRRPRARTFVAPAAPRVDVLVPTYNESVEILERTLLAAAQMTGAVVRVLLLDDGDRPEMARLAARTGARYVSRSEHRGAKAGNVNHALRTTAVDGAPFVCVFDSDHVPRPNFLARTLGYFADPVVGLVQTPQVYANADAGPITRGAAEQQAIFFGPICSGRDGYDSSFCCGTNFVARREALALAGGFPEDSITEDIVLSTTLVGLGYEIVFVPEPLADGLGPEDAHSYVSQQMRWATGCLELLFRRPQLWRPLSWVQRWQYLVATSHWLTGWTILVYVSLPIVRLLFGWQPVTDSAGAFATHFLPYFLVSVINLGRFTGGGYGLSGLAMTWGSFPIHVRATLVALSGKRIGFAVTPKRALSGIPWSALSPNLALIALLLGAVAAGIARGLTPATFNNVAFALIDATLAGLIVVFALRQAGGLKKASAQAGPDATRPESASPPRFEHAQRSDPHLTGQAEPESALRGS